MTTENRIRRAPRREEASLDASGPSGADAIDRGESVELGVLSVTGKAVRGRLSGNGRFVVFRASRSCGVIPGEIMVVRPAKRWTYAGQLCFAGKIESTRLDVGALGLVPLKIGDPYPWHPSEHFWGDADEPIADWAKPIIAWGPRPAYEMEQVLPGEDPNDPISDPIIEANDCMGSGDWEGARKILMDLCLSDLRCLDAHAHLGNMVFDRRPHEAIRHYEVGFRIGELSLGDGFDGLLPWGRIDNRPFLRCMNGFGLCLWGLGRFEEAEVLFKRMLWLNPSDNQGVRLFIDDISEKVAWENRTDK